MTHNSIDHQKIRPLLAAAAAAALGGEPTRPPAVATQPVAPYREDPTLAAHREAFRESQLPQPVAAPVLLGHPTFDPAPDALAARREKVGIIRARLNSLGLLIIAENAALQPLISDLDAEAEAVLTGELFNPAIARSFLASLSQTVQALSATPAEK